MPTAEVFALTIAGSIAKYMVARWLDNQLAVQIGQDLLDILRDELGGNIRSDKGVEKLGENIVVQMEPWIEGELYSLDKAERASAIEEAAFALVRARIDMKLLVSLRFDESELAARIRKNGEMHHLSQNGLALYDKLISQSSQWIVKLAPKMEGFDLFTTRSGLQQGDELASILSKLHDRPKNQDLEFERKYRSSLATKLDRMELFGLRRMDELTRYQSLDGAYINLSFELASPVVFVDACRDISITTKKIRNVVDSISDRAISMLYSQFEQQSFEWIYMSSHGQSTPQLVKLELNWDAELWRTLAAIVNPGATSPAHVSLQPRLVLKGKAGSGKSTFLQWAAIQLASDFDFKSSLSRTIVPFYIRLREFVSEGFPSPERFIGSIVPAIAGTMPKGWVNRILNADRGAILIDGVDEVPQNQRMTFLDGLQELMMAYPHNLYIITSRPAAVAKQTWPEWNRWTQDQNFIPLEIKDMTDSQAEMLIERWHKAQADSVIDPDERSMILSLPGSLKRQLKRRPELKRLTVNPLLCAMICAVHYDRRQNLPAERARLYRECVDILLNRRDPGRKIDLKTDYPDLSEIQKEKLVQRVAYWLQKNSYVDAPVAEIDEQFTRLLKLMDMGNITGSEARRLFVERAGLLREPTVDRIDFAHRTFLEYLAALAAVEESDFGLLLSKAQDDQWRETIILAVGEARPVERADFLKKLIAKADRVGSTDQRRQLYMLAAACLETKVELDPSIRDLVLNRMSGFVPPASSEESLTIAKVGNPIAALLGPQSDYSSEEAAACVRALAEVGTSDAINVVAQYSSDKRWAVDEAIGSSWNYFDRDEYLDTVLKQMKRLVAYEPPTNEELGRLAHISDLRLIGWHGDNVSWTDALPNLQSISFSKCQVSDWESFRASEMLRELYVNESDISSIATLAGKQSLTVISATGSNLADLSPIVDLANLQFLSIADTNVSDFSPLEEVSSLQSLTIDVEQYQQAIGSAKQIKELRIEGKVLDSATVLDLSGIAALEALETLFLWPSRCTKIESLLPLKSLSWLGIGASLFDSVGLSALPSLRRLNLLGGAWDEVELDWSKLVQIDSLGLTGSIKTVAGIGELTSLNDLYLGGPGLSSIEPLRDLTNLKVLTLRSEHAKDLKPLANLGNLRELRILGPGRIDRDSLSHFKNLKISRL